ncbi:MAG: ABC transporter substrate-binding protein [Candidatus Cloacimonetes bacterium]|nr:ABC transporter substrate-binding protein [Candidatus Cloacimonadota bacterium]
MKKSVFLILIAIIIVYCSKTETEITTLKPGLIILSPEIAEIVCTLDGEKNILAVINECDYPEILKSKEKVGSFSSPNIEKIVALQPDMIFISGLEQEVIKNKLNKLGMKVYQFYPNNINDLIKIFEDIGKLLNKENSSLKIINTFQSELNSIIIPENKPKIYVEIYNNPLMTVSTNSFIGDIIEKSGGKNIFQNLPRDYCRVSAESIIEKNPDIIIITYSGIVKSEIKNRLGWGNVNAIINDRIYTPEDIDPDLLIRAGPRCIDGIKILSIIFQNFSSSNLRRSLGNEK